jgi:hypothetical protein
MPQRGAAESSLHNIDKAAEGNGARRQVSDIVRYSGSFDSQPALLEVIRLGLGRTQWLFPEHCIRHVPSEDERAERSDYVEIEFVVRVAMELRDEPGQEGQEKRSDPRQEKRAQPQSMIAAAHRV